MKKLFVILLIMSFPAFSLAIDDENSFGDITDMYKYSDTFTNPYAGQKQITDEEFQKTVDEIKAKQKKRIRKKDRMPEKNTIKQDDEGGYIDETSEGASILNVPLALVNGDYTVIPVGYYKVVGVQEDNKYFLNLWQGNSVIAKVPAIMTKHDFDEKEINFAKILPYDEQRVKLIFGSIDFNAYTFLSILK